MHPLTHRPAVSGADAPLPTHGANDRRRMARRLCSCSLRCDGFIPQLAKAGSDFLLHETIDGVNFSYYKTPFRLQSDGLIPVDLGTPSGISTCVCLSRSLALTAAVAAALIGAIVRVNSLSNSSQARLSAGSKMGPRHTTYTSRVGKGHKKGQEQAGSAHTALGPMPRYRPRCRARRHSTRCPALERTGSMPLEC